MSDNKQDMEDSQERLDALKIEIEKQTSTVESSTAKLAELADEAAKAQSTLAKAYHEKKVLQLHMCWSVCVTDFLLVAEKTCNAKIISENRNKRRLPSISCMRKVVCVAGLA